jgi:hypothetical protein
MIYYTKSSIYIGKLRKELRYIDYLDPKNTIRSEL